MKGSLSCPRGMLWFIVLLALLVSSTSCVAAQGDSKNDAITISTSPQQDVPTWAAPYPLILNLIAQPGGSASVKYTVIPLTTNIGLNGTNITRSTIRIQGQLAAANASTYGNLKGNQTIAYLSCDPSPASDGLFDPDKMLSQLMRAQLAAIVLYSTNKNICLINDVSPSYTSILSMADGGEAGSVLTYLNGTRPVTSVNAVISGMPDHATTDPGAGDSGGNNSAVAMSILYSITGIITLLFLVIIVTGAIRAHRYPERYGPSGGYGGRPRQSRAKGLARAVLDTIPIVKFGNQQPAKPDPDLELDTTGTEARRDALKKRTGTPDKTRDEAPEAKSSVVAAGGSGLEPSSKAGSQAADAVAEGSESSPNESQAGCSICTEDFEVGEDVRVLPCRHQYHPHCVDPWLVDVSGTCPLCRLDLRPERIRASSGPSEHGESLAPPLVLDGEDGEGSQASHGNRLMRIFDANRLRQLSVEERIETLRQMRNQPRPLDSDHDQERDGSYAAKLTYKLKTKFRIRTRSQPASHV